MTSPFVSTRQRTPLLERSALADARNEKLFFAQVREDPLVELEGLRLQPTDKVVVVGSGGCTALSMLAAGVGEVVSVDLNKSQNHIVELKAAAINALQSDEAVRFLGGWPMAADKRLAIYKNLRPALSAEAAGFWDERTRKIGKGVINAGACEMFMRLQVRAVRTLVHRQSTIRRMFDARTLDEQCAYYRSEWNTRAWRTYLKVLVNRFTFGRTFHPDFFKHVENSSFSDYYLSLIEHVLTEVPLQSNYFFHQMLNGFYPTDVEGGLPPYLQHEGQMVQKDRFDRFTVVDASVTQYLKSQPDRSVDAFSLSNITEWMDASGVDELFGEIARTATPGARLVFRNFVGWTEIPQQFRNVIVEDRPLSDRLIAGDRSGMQKRVTICTVAVGS